MTSLIDSDKNKPSSSSSNCVSFHDDICFLEKETIEENLFLEKETIEENLD